MRIYSEHPIQSDLRLLYANALVDKAKALHLADTRAWRTLIHYDSFLGITRSEARDKEKKGDFFLSPQGERNPESELKATILALFLDTQSSDPARCRFPAREIYLTRALAIDTSRLGPVNCREYDGWRKNNAAKGASIVFASFFMGNPSSLFGHTFLRLHNAHGNALLDASFNFAANAPDDENAIVYAWRGMTGGFPGLFSMHPYYVKINEYNDMESRDLWEFTLDLTENELHFLEAHLWELSYASFPYYYLDENCSYQLLALLEAVRPQAHLNSRFSYFVAPTDTLHTLFENNFFTGESKYRASSSTRYFTFYENATPVARSTMVLLKKNRALPQTHTNNDTQAVDMLIEYYKYTNEYNMAAWPVENREHYQNLLSWRAQVPHENTLEKFVRAHNEENPLTGFKSSSIALGYAYEKTLGGAVALDYRPALRTLADSWRGFSPWSQIQMLQVALSYFPHTQSLRLDEFNIVDIFALSPWQAHIHKISYRLRTGLYRHNALQSYNAATLSWDSTAGIGITLLPLKRVGFFVLAEANAYVRPAWQSAVQLAPSLLTGFKFNWSPAFATTLSYHIDYAFLSPQIIEQKTVIHTTLAVAQNTAIEVKFFYAWAAVETLPSATYLDAIRGDFSLRLYF
ncbi:MAG TPA: DUF4105 domain-containing protein [Turneriella sp.]|nr:DUF4105 domain-containing protein [Turneriella sp.]